MRTDVYLLKRAATLGAFVTLLAAGGQAVIEEEEPTIVEPATQPVPKLEPKEAEPEPEKEEPVDYRHWF